jgi:hypothetical protein
VASVIPSRTQSDGAAYSLDKMWLRFDEHFICTLFRSPVDNVFFYVYNQSTPRVDELENIEGVQRKVGTHVTIFLEQELPMCLQVSCSQATLRPH